MALNVRHRLRLKGDIDRVFKDGHRRRTNFFQVITAVTLNQGARAMISVPKSVVSSAVGRNRLRRHFQEALRPYMDNLQNCDVIIVPSVKALQAEYFQIQEELAGIFGKKTK
jgi:ribonuclease P protein component